MLDLVVQVAVEVVSILAALLVHAVVFQATASTFSPRSMDLHVHVAHAMHTEITLLQIVNAMDVVAISMCAVVVTA